jgi:hypothetical protein
VFEAAKIQLFSIQNPISRKKMKKKLRAKGKGLMAKEKMSEVKYLKISL